MLTTVLVWIIITTGGDIPNEVVIHSPKFATQEQCEHVLRNIPARPRTAGKCVQANIVKDWQ